MLSGQPSNPTLLKNYCDLLTLLESPQIADLQDIELKAQLLNLKDLVWLQVTAMKLLSSNDSEDIWLTYISNTCLNRQEQIENLVKCIPLDTWNKLRTAQSNNNNTMSQSPIDIQKSNSELIDKKTSSLEELRARMLQEQNKLNNANISLINHQNMIQKLLNKCHRFKPGSDLYQFYAAEFKEKMDQIDKKKAQIAAIEKKIMELRNQIRNQKTSSQLPQQPSTKRKVSASNAEQTTTTQTIVPNTFSLWYQIPSVTGIVDSQQSMQKKT